MNAKRFFNFSLPVLLLWLVSLPLHAATEAGRILFARGTVSIVDATESSRGGGTGSVFHEGDRVVTGNNSIAQLRMTDGALTALRSNSDYHIQRQRFDEEADVYEQAGRLISGWMRSVTGAIGARYPGNVSQGTSVATIGIRGTTYQVIHVPEEGLAEFPNLQPGTYVYLEEGQVEVSNEAGSRIVTPGQVVRVAGPKATPELAPELTELFQSQVLSGMGGDETDGLTVRDLIDGEQDQIVDNIDDHEGTGPATPFSGTVSGVGAFGGSFGQAGRVSSSNLFWTGELEGRYVEAMILDAQNGETTEPYDLSENGNGSVTGTQYRQIQGVEGMAAQIHWGLWTEGKFDALDPGGFEVSPTGIWHYMFADNALENGSSEMAALGLTGRYAYNYIGGTELNAVDSDGLPAQMVATVDEGRILVHFDSLTMDIDMTFDNGQGTLRLVGSGDVGSFYNAGIYLSPTDTFDPISGNIGGTFVGQQAEGIISALTISDFSESTMTYYGTAAFQSELTPARIFGGVSVLSDGFGKVATVPDFWQMETGENANGVFADQLVFGESTTTYIATGASPSPDQQSGIVIYNSPGDSQSGVATEVYWGIWDETNYDVVDSFDNSATPTSDWHYMVASNPLTEDMVLAIGLTGQYTYNFVDGTPLADVNGTLPDLVIQNGSTVDVNFDTIVSGGIAVDIALQSTNLVGNGSLFDLYGSGISLTDTQDQLGFGSLTGTFAGNQAEALVGGVSYQNDTDAYYGTALFEKGPGPAIGQ
ncbi:FecR family protein [Alcanivorax sp. 1008]|uniref:FecR family protein n=1 Tax=Alcanivorax sp. 1008 TaxID=2816853 RepID=UPI001D4ACE90|nr:FecR family protein [Alcanivorax sp. 1008]MCC1498349.1 hypothetical protein [Alcanivorax sp. 1008]